MGLIHDVKAICDRLAPRGWRDLLRTVTDNALDISKPTVSALQQELTKDLPAINRAQSGFEDFCPRGRAAIYSGNPALSLLYHAFASPNVYPNPHAPRTDEDFPTLTELDTIENYIYSLANKRLADFTNSVIAVFAYQYRAGTRSVHRIHADMAFSRTGIARVGTAPMHYDPFRRSFWPSPAGGGPGIAVMPARYAAFIAERRKLTSKDAVMHPLTADIAGDNQRTFLVPVHKLFSGNECLLGEKIQQVSFLEYHRNEKLRKIHQLSPAKGGVLPLPGFNINQPPFVRESAELVKLQPVGASTLLVPLHRPTLAETAMQHNSVSGRDEIVRFRVPPRAHNNRFVKSSFQIPATQAGRAAPEYAHIRLHVRPNGQLFDLNSLSSADFFKVLKDARIQGIPQVEDGPLEAAHVLDSSCDGVISALVTLSKPLKRFSAVSFVAAPDFLPLVDQMEVQRWAEQNGLAAPGKYFEQGGPTPLCYGRDVAPNPTLPDPANHSNPAFVRADEANQTFAAVISSAPQSDGELLSLASSVSTSSLPDAAADVFEPGWDTSMFRDQDGDFYANFGLGSPFPEDAKLCAALNSFWPAAAPDAGRTFGGMTALPLLDEELGFYPGHPKVLAGQVSSNAGWDGEFGPFFLNKNKQLSFSAMERSDYTVNALQGKISLGLLGRIDAAEQLARMDAFRECADRIRGRTSMSEFTTLLVTAETIEDWSERQDRFNDSLRGSGYLFVFADYVNAKEDSNDRQRRIADVRLRVTCQVSSTLVGTQKDNGIPEVTPRRHS